MDTESILRELINLHRTRKECVERAGSLLRYGAAQLNECAAATGSGFLICLPPSQQREAIVTDGSQPSDHCDSDPPAGAFLPFARLACADLTTEEIVDAGKEVILNTLPHITHWLNTTQDGALVVVNLKRVIDFYYHDLLQVRGLRRTWRAISAAMENLREQSTWNEMNDEALSAVSAFIQHYLALFSNASAVPADGDSNSFRRGEGVCSSGVAQP